MEAQLSFNLDDPIDMREYDHAPKGYRYFLLLNDFIKMLSNEHQFGPKPNTFMAEKYAKELFTMATSHKLTEVASMIKSNLPIEVNGR